MQLVRETDNENISIVELDLSDFQSVRRSVSRLDQPLAGVICNAGIANEKEIRFNKQGIEETFAVNHLGHFLLVNLLLAKFPQMDRVWMVSSNAHLPGQGFIFPPVDMSSIDALAFPPTDNIDVKKENGKHYVNSKLCNVLFTYELDRRLKLQGKTVIVNAFNPGFIPESGLSRDTGARNRFILKYVMPVMRPFIKEMRRLDTSGDHLASLVQNITTTGMYYDGLEPIQSSELSYDEKLAEELWRKSEEWTTLASD